MASAQQAFGNMVIWASETDLATICKEINASVWGASKTSERDLGGNTKGQKRVVKNKTLKNVYIL